MLSGKNILIIGGTTGLGFSAASAFIDHGASVTVTGRSESSCTEAQQELGGNALAIQADASQEGSTEDVIEQCLHHWGEIHGLYHVAGGSGRKFGDGPLHDLTLDGWEETLRLNLTSVMLSNRAVIRLFLGQGIGGAVLNMGSVLGFSPSPTFFSTHAYAAAKSAIIGFSKSIASYYAKENIRINVIAPALVDTPMASRAMQNEDIQRFIKTKQPLEGGRTGLPQDLDAAASLLMSDQASFITGQVLIVDGGWTISEGQYSVGP